MILNRSQILACLLHWKVNEIRRRSVMECGLIIQFQVFLFDLCKLEFESYDLVLENPKVLVDLVKIVYFNFNILSQNKLVDCLLASLYFGSCQFSFQKSKLLVVTTKITKLTFSLAIRWSILIPCWHLKLQKFILLLNYAVLVNNSCFKFFILLLQFQNIDINVEMGISLYLVYQSLASNSKSCSRHSFILVLQIHRQVSYHSCATVTSQTISQNICHHTIPVWYVDSITLLTLVQRYYNLL